MNPGLARELELERLHGDYGRTERVPMNDQCAAALAEANRVRLYRAALKQRVRRGDTTVSAILKDTPRELGTMKVIDLLLAMPRVGKARAERFLHEVQASPRKIVGELSPRQRVLLVRAIAHQECLAELRQRRAA